MPKAKIKHLKPHTVDVVFFLRDHKTKKAIGKQYLVDVEMDAEMVAAAAMKPDEKSEPRGIAYREMLDLTAMTIKLHIAQVLKDWLHP